MNSKLSILSIALLLLLALAALELVAHSG